MSTHSIARGPDGRVIVDGGRWDPYDAVSRKLEAERRAQDPKLLRRGIERALRLLSDGHMSDAECELRAALAPRLPSVKDLEWGVEGLERHQAAKLDPIQNAVRVAKQAVGDE